MLFFTAANKRVLVTPGCMTCLRRGAAVSCNSIVKPLPLSCADSLRNHARIFFSDLTCNAFASFASIVAIYLQLAVRSQSELRVISPFPAIFSTFTVVCYFWGATSVVAVAASQRSASIPPQPITTSLLRVVVRLPMSSVVARVSR